MKNRLLFASILSLASATLLYAQSVTNHLAIHNGDFAISNAPNLELEGWNESADADRYDSQPGGPDGNNFARMFGRFSGNQNRGIWQDLGTPWDVGTYSFTYATAKIQGSAQYVRARLYSGFGAANLPASQTVFDATYFVNTNAVGVWVTNTYTVAITNGHPALGQSMGIRFSPDTQGAAAGNDRSGLDLVGLTLVQPLGQVVYNPPHQRYVVNNYPYVVPTTVGTVTNWSISPAFPASSGLLFSTFDGSISGVTLEPMNETTYTVTARFQEGVTTTTELVIVVVNPSLAAYNPGNVTVTVGTAMPPALPVLLGTDFWIYPTNYLIHPPLPAGITNEPADATFGTGGLIGGTPVALSSNLYTVTAQYENYPDSSANLIIQVVPPVLVRYADNDFRLAVGSTARPVNPTLTGVTAATGYTVSPPLPAGIDLDPSTGQLTGTGLDVTARSNYTITASFASYPDSSVNVAFEVVEGFADDFNGATGALGDDPNWTNAIPADFNVNGRWATGQGGNSGWTGPTTVYEATQYIAGEDFRLSVDIVTGGMSSGLVFGFQDSSNFWMCRVANGASAVGLNNDLLLRYLKDGTNETQVIAYNAGVDIPEGTALTLTVAYDEDTQTLGVEISETNRVYYSGTYALQPEDLPIADGSLFGLQSWTGAGAQLNNFSGNFSDQTLGGASLEITGFQYDAATGAALITWTGHATKTYSLWGGSDVTSLRVLESGIPGVEGDTSVTHTEAIGTPAQFYQVEEE